MTATVETAAQSLKAVMQGALRLNPVLDLDVDVIAIAASAGASTPDDWAAAGTVPSGLTVDDDGTMHLSPGSPVVLFSQTVDASVFQQFNDSGGSPGPAVMWLDFFPNPNLGPLQLANIDLSLGKIFSAIVFTGTFTIYVTQFDDQWNRVPLCSGLAINAKTVTTSPYTVDFTAFGVPLVFYPGLLAAQTGQGLDSTGAPRNVALQVIAGDPVSTLTGARGFSIGIGTSGANAYTAPYLGCAKTTSAAQFDVTQFWRCSDGTHRDCGPYSPYVVGSPPSDTALFPGEGTGATGAVPGFGALSVTNGKWGRSKQILQGPPGPPAEGGRSQNPGQGWHQPYHTLRVQGFTSTATYVGVFDLGATPTEEVEVRIDDQQAIGTSIAYTLQGSNISSSGGWTSIGTVVDGQELTGSQLYRWYQLTAVFHASASGFATPSLSAFFVTSRTVYNTFTYVSDTIDSTATVDPFAGQSEIAELTLPLNRIGPATYTDPATVINTQYAPTALEAYVYAKNRITSDRYFLNSFRLENREPQEGLEQMTFVSGLDQLSCAVPPLVETFVSPLTGSWAVTVVTMLSSTSYRLQIASSPWTAYNPSGLTGFFYWGLTGNGAGQIFTITDNTGNTVTVSWIDGTGAPQAPPQVGDTFVLHSGLFNRPDIVYAGVDFAAIYSDILANQAACPSRYRGQLPATTGRTGTGTITNDNITTDEGGDPANNSYTTALEYLQAIAVHCGGFVAWRRGRIDFVPFYATRTVVAAWDDRTIVTLTPALGADRRTPSVYVKYDYDVVQQSFGAGATYNDINALYGWGRSNLFDVYEMSDDICRWNASDGAEALFLANMYLAAWSTGVRFWQVQTVLQYPWLQEGDCVTINTDLYTDRRMLFSSDGTVDMGTPVRGPVQALGVIVGKNLWGDSFVVAIRGIGDIQSASGLNTEGGSLAAVPCPPIFVTIEQESPEGWFTQIALVSWTNPTEDYFDHMECVVQAVGNSAATVVLGTASPVVLRVSPGTTYTYTPVSVATGGGRTTGTPVTFTTPPSNSTQGSYEYTTTGGAPALVTGGYTVAGAGTTADSYSTWTGTNPNTAVGPPNNVWTPAPAGAVITLTSNPIAFDGNYTLTYSLTGAASTPPLGTSGKVRLMVEVSINGGAWTIYGYTPAENAPYSGTGVTGDINLSGLLSGATSVAFRVTAQALNDGVAIGSTVTAVATATMIQWNYSSGTLLQRTGLQVLPISSEPHISFTPNTTPPTVVNSVAGELTVASLNSGTLTVPQMNDGNAIATYQRYETQHLTADTLISAGTLTAVAGTTIDVGAGETWIIEIDAYWTQSAASEGIFVDLLAGTATFTTHTGNAWAIAASGASSLQQSSPFGVFSSTTLAGGWVRQRHRIVVGTAGTISIGANYQLSADKPTLKAGTSIQGWRVA